VSERGWSDKLIGSIGYGKDRTGAWGSRHRRSKYDRVSVQYAYPPYRLTLPRDDHYYRIQSERSQIFTEKETLEKVYTALLEEHRALQTAHDDVLSEKEDTQAQLRQLRRDADTRRNEKADVMMRAEMDRIRAEL